MKKLLLGVIIILLLALTGITVVKGFNIGNLSILGLQDIQKNNEDLDQKVKQATKLASTDYQFKLDSLNDEVKALESEKTKYEDMVNVSTEGEVQVASQIHDYKIDFLWIKIENHAKSEGVIMKMELTRGTSGAQDVYNLNFTATGSYIGIANFISAIEDDSELGFKIEEFKMTSQSTQNSSKSGVNKNNTTEDENTNTNSNTVQATFTCKDITIKGLSTNIVNQDNTTNDNQNTNDNTNNTDTNNTIDENGNVAE